MIFKWLSWLITFHAYGWVHQWDDSLESGNMLGTIYVSFDHDTQILEVYNYLKKEVKIALQPSKIDYFYHPLSLLPIKPLVAYSFTITLLTNKLPTYAIIGPNR